MNKTKLGPGPHLIPMPTVLVGAMVSGKANFATVAYCGIAGHEPPRIAVSLGKSHHTNIGIRGNKTFSINIPSEDMAAITDYVGLKSGSQIDKSTLFDLFYGELETAPMIVRCPLNMECRLVRTVDMGGGDELFIGEIVQTFVHERFLSDGKPDIKKIKPLLFSMPDSTYYSVGLAAAKAFKVGYTFQRGKSPV